MSRGYRVDKIPADLKWRLNKVKEVCKDKDVLNILFGELDGNVCSDCGDLLPEHRFYSSNKYICKDCLASYQRDYHKRNREMITRKQRELRRRARENYRSRFEIY